MTDMDNEKQTQEQRDSRADDIKFDLVEKSESNYTLLDPAKEGAWTRISTKNGDIGKIWTDNETGFGYLAYVPEPDAMPLVSHVTGLVRSSDIIGATASVGYSSVIMALTNDDKYKLTASEGPLSVLVNPNSEDAKVSPYSLSVEDDGTVLGLSETDEEGDTFIREDGEWIEVDPEEDDPRVYGPSFEYVSEEAVELYDKLSEGDKSHTLENYKDVRVD